MKSISDLQKSSGFGQCHTRLYKELENISLRLVTSQIDVEGRGKNNHKNANRSEQYQVYTKSMKSLMVWGQLIGIMPIKEAKETNAMKIRYETKSMRFFYSLLIVIAELIVTALCIRMLLKQNFRLGNLAYTLFYAACNSTSFLFLLMAKNWSKLCKKISDSSLDEYVDFRVIPRCNILTWVLILLSIFEHVLSAIAKSANVLGCKPNEDFYKALCEYSFPWLFDLGTPFNCLNFVITMTWNFSDIFIICNSIYLASILKKINEKVLNSKDKSLPPCFWRSLRLDYTRATSLVRSFDAIISSIIFTTFATNLFFICLQLFYILSHGLQMKLVNIRENCPSFGNGLLAGKEYEIYLCYSFVFLLGRSTAVLLITSDVHSAASIPAKALFDIPHTAYCEEVQRFIEQVTNNVVALTGLNFFSVTREIALSVAGTIVTYELVLLQFSTEY